MTAKKRGLGRGLDALLSGGGVDISTTQPATQTLHAQLMMPGPWQPRRQIESEALSELADSIRNQGLMQPVVVRPAADGQYEIIAGERRWRACQQAGLDEIPVIVRDVSDENASILALIENIQRENLNPVEEAIALNRLQREGGLTQLQVAEAVGKSRSAVANLLRLLKLMPQVRELLEKGVLEMGHARCLLSLPDEQQLPLAELAIEQRMTVRELEAAVRQAQTPATAEARADYALPEGVSEQLEKQLLQLSEKYATQVSVKPGRNGKGRVVLAYQSPETLEKLLQALS